MSHEPTQRHTHRAAPSLSAPDSVRVGIYTRWPTARGDDLIQSYVESQTGWRTVMRCSDHASGGTLNRPGLQQVLNAVRAGTLDVLLVSHVHNLSFKMRHLHFLLGELDSHGVTFHSSIDQSLDTSTTMGRLQVQMLGSFARLEYEGAREDRRAARSSRTRRSNNRSPSHEPDRKTTSRPGGHRADGNQ